MTDNTDNIVELAAFQARQEAERNAEVITEKAVAAAFTAKYGNELLFDHDMGKWFRWDGQTWICERTRLAFSLAAELAREMTKSDYPKVRVSSGRASFAAGVERLAQADRAFAVTSDIWDQDLYAIGTPGGTVDLRTGELRPARREDFISKRTAVAPADRADCPRWLKFLGEATNGDDGLIAFLQTFFGYGLTGDIKEHCLLFQYGPGANGKSVSQNTIGGIMGDYRVTAAMNTFTASSSDQHPTDLAMLRGARLVTASETEEGRAWAESRIKQITGGDRIAARFMRRDFFEFLPQFKLLLIGNYKPALRNVDDATRRRFNIVPFLHKPAVRDPDLEKKLVAEWPGILRWMIDGCLAWQRSGLVRPPVVLEATEEYFGEQDLVRQWIEKCCDTDRATASDSSTNLFRSWSTWAVANGEKPGTAKWFAQALARLGFKRFRSERERGFLGVEAKPEPATKHWHDDF